MLDLKCDKCGGELKQPGALLFSPPLEDDWTVHKLHLCVDCWLIVAAAVRGPSRSQHRDADSKART
jgi:hypothetical protein